MKTKENKWKKLKGVAKLWSLTEKFMIITYQSFPKISNEVNFFCEVNAWSKFCEKIEKMSLNFKFHIALIDLLHQF